MIPQAELQMFGAFPGHDLQDDDCEALLWLLWPDKERKREASLFGQKWWDYRGLTPAHATYLFSHLLSVEVRRIIRAHIDDSPVRVTPSGKVLDWHPIKAGDIFEPPAASRIAFWRRKIGGLIRARQAADAEGIPYDVFIAAGLKHFYFGGGSYVLARNVDAGGKRTMIPEPNLFYGEDCLAFIRETWLGLLQTRVHAAKLPRYQIVNAGHHPDHQAHIAWLRQQLEHRLVQDWAAARMVGEGLLTRGQALGMVRKPEALLRRLDASP